jgi:hypothetical protein
MFLYSVGCTNNFPRREKMLIKGRWYISSIEKQDSERADFSSSIIGNDFLDFNKKGEVEFRSNTRVYNFDFYLNSDSILFIDSSDTLIFLIKKLSSKELIISALEDTIPLTFHYSNDSGRYPYLKQIKELIFN